MMVDSKISLNYFYKNVLLLFEIWVINYRMIFLEKAHSARVFSFFLIP